MSPAPSLSPPMAAAARQLADDLPRPLGGTEDGQHSRAQSLILDIASRLDGVCTHLTDTEFAHLVLEIARVRVRHEARAGE